MLDQFTSVPQFFQNVQDVLLRERCDLVMFFLGCSLATSMEHASSASTTLVQQAK
jgi:hypothetical protein